MSASIERPATLDGIEEIKSFLTREALAGGVPELELGRLALALEEVLVSILHHAYPKAEGRTNPRHTLQLACKAREGQLLVRIADRGRPFNALAVPAGGMDQAAGGMGLYLVRTIMTKVQYERLGEYNILRLLYKSKAAP